MFRSLVFFAFMLSVCWSTQARDFENSYAVYGAGAQPCSTYLLSLEKGGSEQNFFIDWLIGYFSAFNVIMPNTHNILGETDFPTAQRWLESRCQKYPRELFVNAAARLTEILYPMRYESGLKNPPKGNPAAVNVKAAKPRPKFSDIKIR